MDKSLEVKINHLTEGMTDTATGGMHVEEIDQMTYLIEKYKSEAIIELSAMINKTEQKLNALEADLDKSIMRLRGAVAIALVIGIWAVVYALITM